MSPRAFPTLEQAFAFNATVTAGHSFIKPLSEYYIIDRFCRILF